MRQLAQIWVAAALLLAGLALSVAGCAKGTSAAQPQDLSVKTICPGNPGLCAGMCCGTECVDTAVDVHNCGACGTQCSSGTVCQNGACGCLPTGAACGMGQSCCGTAGCKSLASDINNCGACGKHCGDGATCENGLCKCGGATCAATDVCCAGACAPSCASAPDMAMSSCACNPACLSFDTCVGANCCFITGAALGLCSPDPTCIIPSP